MVRERVAALHVIEPRCDSQRLSTLGPDKGYYAEDSVSELRSLNVAPHVETPARRSALDGRTIRYASYRTSQIVRERTEEALACAKATAGLRTTRHLGLDCVG